VYDLKSNLSFPATCCQSVKAHSREGIGNVLIELLTLRTNARRLFPSKIFINLIMKMIVYDVTDVDVKLIKFYSTDPYEGFTDVPGREVRDVASELMEIEAIERRNPIAFIKQQNGSYLLLTKKE
jgi:hypothetical protein